MKKLVIYSLLLSLILLVAALSYFSVFGVKTKSFNNQVKETVNKFDKNLDIEIENIELFLNLPKLKIEAKTFNSKITYKNENIGIESVKTQISIGSFFKKEFVVKDLYLSTKSIKIKKIISLISSYNNIPEIFILSNKIKNGTLVADIKINFDESGRIKKNFEIDGYVKDGQIDLLAGYNFNKIDFIFKIDQKNYEFKDIKLSLNDLDLFSQRISLINKKEGIFIEGNLENKILKINKEKILDIKKFYPKVNGIEKIEFSSKNHFSFNLNDDFNISNLLLKSKIKIENLVFENKKKGKYFFPEIKDKILIKNHNIEIKLKDNIYLIEGSGDLLIQKNLDSIEYSISNHNQNNQFIANLHLKQNPFYIDFLNFKKNIKSNTTLSTEIILDESGKINFKNIKILESNNKIIFENIFLDKNFRIIQIDLIDLDYIDSKSKKNSIKLLRNEDIYNLTGKIFNADSITTKILESNNSKNYLFKKNFDLNMKIDQVFLDEKNFLKNFNGNIQMIDNKVKSANISSNFSNDKKFEFSIKTVNNQKITTLFSQKAEPLVQRYKFIKGFEDGTLDFYSEKIDDVSKSKIKIFNFKLQELPALTKLLTLASLQGIADTLTGEGIRFNELEMNFTNKGSLMTIDELYAIGPAISILMDGYVEKDKLISLRGTLVPATTINKTIGSIPFLGKILVGSKVGEGVFGVSFKIKGHPDDLQTRVNPIKTLTPRFITRTLEKIKNN
tara:strand:+ start:23 stop:2212 length:2190 start_codon:yes stop_codon:yes gene_type:complete